MKIKYRLLVLLALFQVFSLNANNDDNAKRLGEALLGLEFRLKSPAIIREAIQLNVTFINKTDSERKVKGAFQIDTERAGLIIKILDRDGKLVSSSKSNNDSLSIIKLGPEKRKSDDISLPIEMTPKRAGTYSVSLEYHSGFYVGDEGYKKNIIVTAPKVKFQLKKDTTQLIKKVSDYKQWRYNLSKVKAGKRISILEKAAKDPNSRVFLAAALNDPKLPKAIRLESGNELINNKFPYYAGITNLLENRKEDTDLKILAVKVIPWMEIPSKERFKIQKLLKKQWLIATEKSSLEYQLAILDALNKLGEKPEKLLLLVAKKKVPEAELFIAHLCLQTDINQSKKIALNLKENKSAVNRDVLNEYMPIKTGEDTSAIAKRYLKIIDLLEKE